MRSFGREVNAINTLWWHCLQLAGHRTRGALPPQQGENPVGRSMKYFIIVDPPSAWDAESGAQLLLARTKLASPWTSVLTTIADRTAPIGYGVAGLWVLQRLLNMVMGWQRHRLELELDRQRLAATHIPTAEELVVNHASAELAAHADESDLAGDMVAVDGKAVAYAVQGLRPILDARILDEDDPDTNL